MRLHRLVSRLTLAALPLLVAPSCSFLLPKTQDLTVTASEPEAEIFVDGQLVGTGSATVAVRRDHSHTVMARVGNRSNLVITGVDISVVGALDLIGGFLIWLPYIGIAAPGFNALETDNVRITIPTSAPTTAGG